MSTDNSLLSGPLKKLYTGVNSKAQSSVTKKRNYDVIVLGVGSMGSATCHFLAQDGYNVLGLEQFDISHDKGSHTGQSRIIRQSYFEHPDYVPLLKRAYENWDALAHQSGAQLYHKTGLLYFGRAKHELIDGTIKSASKYKIQVDKLSSKQVQDNYSQFDLPANFEKLYEPNAGFVAPERAILVYAALAMANNAEIHTQEKVIKWSTTGDSIKVVTNKGDYNCNKLVITVGAWSAELMPQMSKQLKVTKQIIGWVNTKNKASFELGNFPCWTLADDDYQGIFYGFPILPEDTFSGPIGLKLGLHYPGVETDPNNLEREPANEDKEVLIDFLNKYLPDAYESISQFLPCMYTNTADADFIIDFLPDTEHVIQASGFSGHGFKFCSAVGEILKDLAISGKTSQPIDFLRASRF